MLEDWGEHEALWVGAACAPRRPAVLNAETRRRWVKALDLPFRTDEPSVALMRSYCQSCTLLADCFVAGASAAYGIWAGEIHEPDAEAS